MIGKERKEGEHKRQEIKCIKCGKWGYADSEKCYYCTTAFPSKVVIMDFNMSFCSMVKFMIKWTFAAMPAICLLIVLIVPIFMFLTAILHGFSKR